MTEELYGLLLLNRLFSLLQEITKNNILTISSYPYILTLVNTSVKAPVAELADAPDLGSGGRPWRFKSSRGHLTFKMRISY